MPIRVAELRLPEATRDFLRADNVDSVFFQVLGTCGELGVGDQTDQDTVEQIDVIGMEGRGALEKQLADPARGLGTAFGIATSDNFVEFGDQLCRSCHKPA